MLNFIKRKSFGIVFAISLALLAIAAAPRSISWFPNTFWGNILSTSDADSARSLLGASEKTPNRIIVVEGDSTSDSDSWLKYFTNGVWASQGNIILATNFATSSDGVGYGHPDALNATTYKAITSVVINGSGLATATMVGYNWSWQTIRKFMVSSASVPALYNRYTISAPVYAGGNTTFTFQTTLGAQTITDARIEFGAVTRYAPLVRPLKPTGNQEGYYICYIGLNDGGRVYQTGDLSGLYGVSGGWANAISNLAYCAKADGFKTVFMTQWLQKNSWSSYGRGAGYAMNDVVRNLRDANGNPLVDYLVDLEQTFNNPYDRRFFDADGLHLSTAGYMALAEEVDRTLRVGSIYSPLASWTNEVRYFPLLQAGMYPENYLTAPVGVMYLNRAATNYDVAWIKTSGTARNNWEKIPMGKATNIWSGSNAFTGPLVSTGGITATPATGQTVPALRINHTNGNPALVVTEDGVVGIGYSTPPLNHTTYQLQVINSIYAGNGIVAEGDMRVGASQSFYHTGRNRWRSINDGTMTWTKDDGITVTQANTNGVFSAQYALRIGQLSGIPTNAIPVNSTTSSVTNWFFVNIKGIPQLIATNYAEGGWLTKSLWP